MSIAEKLTTIAENEQRVYDAGFDIGKTEGYSDGLIGGLTQGMQDEYDRFWDGFQLNGNRRSYAYGFCGSGWNEETYKVKYPIIATGDAQNMHRSSGVTDITNVDTFGVTSAYCFAYACTKLLTIDKLDFSNATNTQSAFAHSTVLHTIGELVSSEKTVWSANTFQNCYNLVTVMFTKESIIATNFNCTSNELTRESLMSIINALKDFSAEGGTHTCTIGTTNLAKLTDTEKAIATEKGWTLA